MLQHEGYTVETLKGSLNEDELCEKLKMYLFWVFALKQCN